MKTSFSVNRLSRIYEKFMSLRFKGTLLEAWEARRENTENGFSSFLHEVPSLISLNRKGYLTTDEVALSGQECQHIHFMNEMIRIYGEQEE